MCDYSLHNVKSRPAKVGDELRTHAFNAWTCGFAAREDSNTAVCVLPGTELAFARPVSCRPRGLLGWKSRIVVQPPRLLGACLEDRGVVNLIA